MTVVLVRHGQSTANIKGILAGQMSGIGLTDTGFEDAENINKLLGNQKIDAIYSSPMQRCIETIKPVSLSLGLNIIEAKELIEIDYGTWSGQKLSDLSKTEEWKIVVKKPSSMFFPDGESILDASNRSIKFIRDKDRELTNNYTEPKTWIACSHGDIIKSIIADAYGMHLDLFQRINVLPGSISVINYSSSHTTVECVNYHEKAIIVTNSQSAPSNYIGGATGSEKK